MFEISVPELSVETEKVQNCGNKDCNRLNCEQISTELRCKHRSGAWALRPDGGHVLEKVVLNEIGDTMYFLCHRCHTQSFNVLGLPVKVNSEKNLGEPMFDLNNPEHISRLLPHLKTFVTPVNETTVSLSRSVAHIDTNGLPHRQPTTTRVSITHNRRTGKKRITIAKALKRVLKKGNKLISFKEQQEIHSVLEEIRGQIEARKRKNQFNSI